MPTIVRFCLLICLIAAGCSSGHHSASSREASTIRIGAGGGFSGYYSGYSFKSTGEVVSWQRRSLTSPDTVLGSATLSADSVDFFFRYLDEVNFSALDYLSSGNMNYSIEYTIGEKTHRVSWGDSDPSAPEEIKVFYTLAAGAGHKITVSK
ncbi:MAG TPA: hypothetical protein VFO76_12340 [Candidatus Kapabacteria bacterium]|nr:hypothetical protein [Candidatus Kapabacteria bacterium]